MAASPDHRPRVAAQRREAMRARGLDAGLATIVARGVAGTSVATLRGLYAASKLQSSVVSADDVVGPRPRQVRIRHIEIRHIEDAAGYRRRDS